MSEFTKIQLGQDAWHSVNGKIQSFRVSRVDISRTIHSQKMTYDGKDASECYGTKNECIDAEMFKLQQQRDFKG